MSMEKGSLWKEKSFNLQWKKNLYFGYPWLDVLCVFCWFISVYNFLCMVINSLVPNDAMRRHELP